MNDFELTVPRPVIQFIVFVYILAFDNRTLDLATACIHVSISRENLYVYLGFSGSTYKSGFHS